MSIQDKGDAGGLFVAWKAAWQSAAFRVQTLTTIPLLIAILILFSRFLEWVELRPGVVLPDPFIATVEPHDFTVLIFIFIYGSLIVGLGAIITHPHRLILALQSYILIVCIRVAAMYVTPLDPPPGIIPLADPLVQFFGSGKAPTKDLFFSGHTSTLLLLSLTATKRWLKWCFALSAACVGVLIVCQHVHYVVDVLVAPFVAYVSLRLATSIQRSALSMKG
ncbi:MAG: hypothetical protein HW412_1823 [Bacteroidetes bacterium]|nr:hypothetical protein [Bacteroidota bacterium]